jgi:hypothetical protein
MLYVAFHGLQSQATRFAVATIHALGHHIVPIRIIGGHVDLIARLSWISSIIDHPEVFIALTLLPLRSRSRPDAEQTPGLSCVRTNLYTNETAISVRAVFDAHDAVHIGVQEVRIPRLGDASYRRASMQWKQTFEAVLVGIAQYRNPRRYAWSAAHNAD